MLTAVSRRGLQRIKLLGVCEAVSLTSIQQRRLQLFDIFDKEKAKERKQKLKEEASRGYFDDFKELKDKQGKIFGASHTLIPIPEAATVPAAKLLRPDGSETSLLAETQDKTISLLCLAFRSGAEAHLASWSTPFGQSYKRSECQHIELSLVDSIVMTWWPFRNLILKGTSPKAEESALKPKYLFNFGEAKDFFDTLKLSNRLTGYVFLIDRKGRIRWRGSGQATSEEEADFLSCCKVLIDEK